MHSDPAPRRGDWIQTFTGRQFWPMDPRASEIEIEDIAHSLAMQCRYTGHCRRFYSVAEHSVLVALHVPLEHAMWGLLHDATEAYLTDVPRPVKPFLPGYREAETRLQVAVAQRFGLPAEIPGAVHEADFRILSDERQQNMAAPPVRWSTDAAPLGVELRCFDPKTAKAVFLSTFNVLRALAGKPRPGRLADMVLRESDLTRE